MKNVVAYIRVITDNQVGEDDFCFEEQKLQIIEYCRSNDLNISKWFSDEGESGSKYSPCFDAIVYGEVTNPPYEAVVVAKSDRISRDINVYYYYKMCLMKKDIKLISIKEDFEQSGVFAQMLEAFTLCVANMERENLAKRTSAGRKVKAAQGGYCGGRAPFGYRVENGELVINETEARAVRRIFELRGEGKTYRAIADIMDNEGYVARSGKPINFREVCRVIDNEKTYRGFYKYSDGDWVQGRQEPIL